MSPKKCLFLSSVLLLAVLLPSCGGGGSTPTLTSSNLVLNKLVSGLTNPLGLEKPPGDARWIALREEEDPGSAWVWSGVLGCPVRIA